MNQTQIEFEHADELPEDLYERRHYLPNQEPPRQSAIPPTQDVSAETFANVYAGGGFQKTIAAARRYGVPVDYAEEIAQRVWCRGWERRNQLRNEARLLSWVLKSVRNDFLDDLRRRRPVSLSTDAPEPAIAPNVNVAAIDLHLALARCRQAKLLRRVYLQQEDFESVAADLGITVDALHHRLSRARKALRKAIETGSQSDKNVSLLDVHNYEERKRTAGEAGDEKAPAADVAAIVRSPERTKTRSARLTTTTNRVGRTKDIVRALSHIAI